MDIHGIERWRCWISLHISTVVSVCSSCEQAQSSGVCFKEEVLLIHGLGYQRLHDIKQPNIAPTTHPLIKRKMTRTYSWTLALYVYNKSNRLFTCEYCNYVNHIVPSNVGNEIPFRSGLLLAHHNFPFLLNAPIIQAHYHFPHSINASSCFWQYLCVYNLAFIGDL